MIRNRKPFVSSGRTNRGMERSKSEASVVCPASSAVSSSSAVLKKKTDAELAEHSSNGDTNCNTSNGHNISSSMSNLSANTSALNSSANSSTRTLGGPQQKAKRRSRFGSLYQSILFNETKESTLSPNAVRGIMNPMRSRLGLPPLEQARLAVSPESEIDGSGSLPSVPAEPETVDSIVAPSSTNVTPPTPGNTEEMVTPEMDPSPLIVIPVPPPIPRVKSKAQPTSRYFLEDQKFAATRSNPGIAAVVRPNPLPIHKTPVNSKAFCPPPAVPQSQRPASVQNRSMKKPSSGWRFPTEFVGDKEYLLMKLIGRGGCGEVSLAMEKETRDLFALKKISLIGLDQSGIDECINEIKLLVELKDTNFVIHIEAWEMNPTEHSIKIVMEYGQCDLNKSISLENPMTLNKVKAIWERMLHIVQTIHQRGIVHADLKPANFVWVGGNLKIIDFGIANKVQPEFTSIATLNPKGTLNFISPETLNQDAFGRAKIGPKSDIWSLGCILYYMIFGETPFQQITHQMAKIHAIINGVKAYPPLPTEFEGSSILSVLYHCFQIDPKKRPTAAQLLTHSFIQTQSRSSS